MSGEALLIVGVVVGAIVAGLAQVVARRLRIRRSSVADQHGTDDAAAGSDRHQFWLAVLGILSTLAVAVVGSGVTLWTTKEQIDANVSQTARSDLNDDRAVAYATLLEVDARLTDAATQFQVTRWDGKDPVKGASVPVTISPETGRSMRAAMRALRKDLVAFERADATVSIIGSDTVAEASADALLKHRQAVTILWTWAVKSYDVLAGVEVPAGAPPLLYPVWPKIDYSNEWVASLPDQADDRRVKLKTSMRMSLGAGI